MNGFQGLLCHPEDGSPLVRRDDRLLAADGTTAARQVDNVWCFLSSRNDFYEGAYLNRTKYLPVQDSWLGRLPFWLVNNGYVWEVCKSFPAESTLLELGCASGVDFLAKRYQMIGADYSLQSLRGLNGYRLALQADAEQLPIKEQSVDGIISSYFWEHIEPKAKDRLLTKFSRYLKPGGKIVFLYDVTTENRLISKARRSDPQLYQQLFLDGDGHVGYETFRDNQTRFEKHGFRVQKQIGMERTWLQANAVFEKLTVFQGIPGLVGRLGSLLSSGKVKNLLNTTLVRGTDVTFGRFWPIDCSRILLTVAEKRL